MFTLPYNMGYVYLGLWEMKHLSVEVSCREIKEILGTRVKSSGTPKLL